MKILFIHKYCGRGGEKFRHRREFQTRTPGSMCRGKTYKRRRTQNVVKFIMNIFCKQPDQEKCFKILSVSVKVSDHDIDFRINTSLGAMGVELVEDAPLTKEGYKNLKSKYSAQERYEYLKGLIQSKSEKYKSYGKTKTKSLIIYNTDGKLGLIDSITALVIKYCHTNTMIFNHIFYLNPRPDFAAILVLFYPQNKRVLEAVSSANEAELLRDGYTTLI